MGKRRALPRPPAQRLRHARRRALEASASSSIKSLVHVRPRSLRSSLDDPGQVSPPKSLPKSATRHILHETEETYGALCWSMSVQI